MKNQLNKNYYIYKKQIINNGINTIVKITGKM